MHAIIEDAAGSVTIDRPRHDDVRELGQVVPDQPEVCRLAPITELGDQALLEFLDDADDVVVAARRAVPIEKLRDLAQCLDINAPAR